MTVSGISGFVAAYSNSSSIYLTNTYLSGSFVSSVGSGSIVGTSIGITYISF